MQKATIKDMKYFPFNHIKGYSSRPSILVIRSVSDVLRAKSRLVKLRGRGVEAAVRTPYTFYKPTLGPKYVKTDLITNLSRHQPLFSRY